MLHQERYTLTWHSSYSDHLKELLKEMMTSSQFADVTLVTDDKQQIRAHRKILSAASPVFKSILQIDSKNANPVFTSEEFSILKWSQSCNLSIWERQDFMKRE